jgi:hypothetical protein
MELERIIQRERKLAYWLDDRFRIPFTRWRLGLDGIIGLVPGIGDAVTTLLALHVVYEARRHGVPASGIARMGLNVGIDAVVGLIPLVGDVADVGWKANRRNIKILIEHLERRQAALPDTAGQQRA